jgi:hypothetical protein
MKGLRTMSKSQCIGWATVAGITAVCCWTITGLGLIGTTAFIVCTGFMLLYGYKHWSHARKLKEAQADAQQALPPVITMTSPGSSRLFVPPPLDRQ